MGKRQVIYRPDRIAGSKELLNREVNLVTKEARVWHGTITAIGPAEVELKDARKGTHRIAFAHIDRIYSDSKTGY